MKIKELFDSYKNSKLLQQQYDDICRDYGLQGNKIISRNALILNRLRREAKNLGSSTRDVEISFLDSPS